MVHRWYRLVDAQDIESDYSLSVCLGDKSGQEAVFSQRQ